jgi:epoxyqueuosine reductase QueG
MEKTAIEAKWLKNLVIETGADDVGLASIDAPTLSDQRKEIIEAFPGTKTIVGIVYRLNRETIRCAHRSVADLEYIQGYKELDSISRKVVKKLEKEGIKAISIPGGFPMEMSLWPDKVWVIPHKLVAEAAGLGKMGHHRLVTHPRFGNFIVLGTILMDQKADVYDRPLDTSPCLECKLCAAVCPVGAVCADGHFNFAACGTHNYRDRIGGFSDWVENVVSSKTVKEYRKKVSDPETISMWQTLSYGICNKSSYCMAVCPAGEEVEKEYKKDKKAYLQRYVKPLQKKEEMVFLIPGSDAEAHVKKKFPHKKIKYVGNGLRPKSVKNFLEFMPYIFQREQSGGINATFHFTFNGSENYKATVVIKDKTINVAEEHQGKPDLHLVADSSTWVKFLAKEKNLLSALLTRKIRVKGSPKLMSAFARCFPS